MQDRTALAAALTRSGFRSHDTTITEDGIEQEVTLFDHAGVKVFVYREDGYRVALFAFDGRGQLRYGIRFDGGTPNEVVAAAALAA